MRTSTLAPASSVDVDELDRDLASAAMDSAFAAKQSRLHGIRTHNWDGDQLIADLPDRTPMTPQLLDRVARITGTRCRPHPLGGCGSTAQVRVHLYRWAAHQLDN